MAILSNGGVLLRCDKCGRIIDTMKAGVECLRIVKGVRCGGTFQRTHVKELDQISSSQVVLNEYLYEVWINSIQTRAKLGF